MQVSVEAVDGLKRKASVELPAEKIDAAVEVRVKELGKTMSVKGFRKGKVPAGWLKKQHGKDIRAEVVEKLIDESFKEVIKQENLEILTQPEINLITKDLKEGQVVQYEVEFDIFPEINLSKISDIMIDKANYTVNNDDIDFVKNRWLKLDAVWSLSENPVKADDRVTIDITIWKKTSDNVSEEDLNADTLIEETTDQVVELGEQKLLASIEEALVGAKLNEKVAIDTVLPESRIKSEYDDEPVIIHVTVKQIESAKIPEVTQEFIERYAGKDATLEQLDEVIKTRLIAEAEAKEKPAFMKKVISAIASAYDFEVPESVLTNEKNQFLANRGSNLENSEDLGILNAEEEAEVLENSRMNLITTKYIREEDLKPTDGLIRQAIYKMVENESDPQKAIDHITQNKEMMNWIAYSVVNTQAMELIAEKLQTNPVDKPVKEVLDY